MTINMHRNWRRSDSRSVALDCVKLFNDDPGTDAMILIGEIGGSAEEEPRNGSKELQKPVAAFIAGKTARRAADGACRCDHFRRKRNCRGKN